MATSAPAPAASTEIWGMLAAIPAGGHYPFGASGVLMLAALERWVRSARERRGLHLVVVQVRFLIGFAFMPPGLKKVLGQPFTELGNAGPFHDFLRAFHATGFFYEFVGVVQLGAAVLLLTQRFASVGALIAAPILTTILVLCWSTKVYPTAVVVTLMFLATVALLLWDIDKWRGVFRSDLDQTESGATRSPPLIDWGLWRGCGVAIVGLYFSVCVWTGEVYRPRGVELDEPRFYLLPAVALLPVITFVIDQRRRRRARDAG